MTRKRDLYRRLFRQSKRKQEKSEDASSSPSTASENMDGIEAPFKIDDGRAGRYEIIRTIGGKEGHGGIHSGMGIVRIIYDYETRMLYALKTFQEHFLASTRVRAAFLREALNWIHLESHPYIVQAHWVMEFGTQPHIWLEYITPDKNKRNCLSHYLTGHPITMEEILRWSIQFCHGMEYSFEKGIMCHRDVKPDNIMITANRDVKITDFGLAGAIDNTIPVDNDRAFGGQWEESGSGLSIIRIGKGVICGTPGYMAPEVLRREGADVRSDVFSFGIVLYQMATGIKASPFLQMRNEPCGVEALARIDTPIWPIIECCLVAQPGRRYQSFRELRSDLEPLLQQRTREFFNPPNVKQRQNPELLSNKGESLRALGQLDEALKSIDLALELDQSYAQAWSNKGAVLADMDRYEEALTYCQKAIELDPRLYPAWYTMGGALYALRRHEEAISCFDMVLEIEPWSEAWNSKGLTLESLGRIKEAISCYDNALQINPRNTNTLINKGSLSRALGQPEEAIAYFDQALEIDPLLAKAWNNKGNTYLSLHRHEQAINCYYRALDIDAQIPESWYGKGLALNAEGRYEEALLCYDRALEINSQYAEVWNAKGIALSNLGKLKEAIYCHDHVLKTEKKSEWALAWTHKGTAFGTLGQYEQAITCFDRAIEIDPQDAVAWFNHALASEKLGLSKQAVNSYRSFIACAPKQYAQQINLARQRIEELDG